VGRHLRLLLGKTGLGSRDPVLSALRHHVGSIASGKGTAAAGAAPGFPASCSPGSHPEPCRTRPIFPTPWFSTRNQRLRPSCPRVIYCGAGNHQNGCWAAKRGVGRYLLRTPSDAGAHGVSPTEPNMRLAVDQFAESLQTHATNPPAAPGLPLYNLAKSLAKLLETARRELDSDCEAAKAALVTASSILKSEIERNSGANGSRPGALAGWQIARVRAFIEENLHSNIDVRDLGVVAQQSPAHFSRSFKQAFGEPPHAYVIKRRLERACHLMATTSESLSVIALSVGFADQAHLCRLFRRAFGQSPSTWRRQH
jgi:AraC family transcriptional regulator